jgi:GrpB-like predicted nucleotidyltransferase (UPF0157 family)
MPLTSQLGDHDSGLSERFKAEANVFNDAFGDNFVSVHHIGSTGVPGLVAKPEVDILLVLRKADGFEDHQEIMESLGYEFDGEPQPQNWYYQKDTDGRRSHKTHICRVGHEEIWRYLLFRDYLIDHPERAEAYGELKLTLQKGNKSGMREYVDGKQDFILETIELALKEGREKPQS